MLTKIITMFCCQPAACAAHLVLGAALYPLLLAIARQFRLYLQAFFACRVLVSAALRFSQYAVSRYTFKAVPRQARLGIFHKGFSPNSPDMGRYVLY